MFPRCAVAGGGGDGLVITSSTGLRFLFALPASEVEDSIIPVGFLCSDYDAREVDRSAGADLEERRTAELSTSRSFFRDGLALPDVL